MKRGFPFVDADDPGKPLLYDVWSFFAYSSFPIKRNVRLSAEER